jgi:uncharacterized membrane protein
MGIFLGIIIVVLLISLRLSVLKRLDGLERKINQLTKNAIADKKVESVVEKPVVAESFKSIQASVPEKPIAVKAIALQPKPFTEPIVTKQIVQPEVKKAIPKPKKNKKSFEAWEKFIGENLLNKIGIAILVLGIGYFVKFAIDKDWIGEIGRVAIGVFCGGVLIGIAHKLRKTFRSFSSVLTGGGIVVLYFTIALGFMEYEIFGQTAAFLLMLIITVFGSLLSIAYDRVELAVISLIGGLAAPILVSTGDGNYQILFTYLIILNAGMLAVAYIKQWKLINILSLIGTVIMIGGWLVKLTPGEVSYNPLLALTFGSILFLEFFMMNILRNIKLKIDFKAFDFSLLLANTALFYSFGMIVLSNYHDGLLQGLFTVGLGLFNFGFAFFLRKKTEVDKNIIYLLIGLVLTLGSLAAPIQLDGNSITLFWAAEMCLLLWLYQKSNITLIKLGSVLVFLATIVSLFMDWANLYAYNTEMETILNSAFITGLFVTTTLIFYRFLLKKETEKFFGITIDSIKKVISGISLALGFIVGLLEVNYILSVHEEVHLVRDVWQAIYILVFTIVAMLFVGKKGDNSTKLVFTPLSFIVIILYLFHYQDAINSIRYRTFTQGLPKSGIFNVHYISTALFGVLVFQLFRMVNSSESLKAIFGRFIRPVIALIILLICSMELNHLSTQFLADSESYFSNLKQTRKVGYALLWGVLSFVFMFIGIQKKEKAWRLISLALLAITLIKLFVFDIRGLSEGGKIAAFIGLGVLLLILSFMYQKVKDLILNDEKND